MLDRPADFRPLDPGRVNLSDPVEMSYWCEHFGCGLAELEAAIRQVGEHVAELRQELGVPRPH